MKSNMKEREGQLKIWDIYAHTASASRAIGTDSPQYNGRDKGTRKSESKNNTEIAEEVGLT
jgi:hypothetical protein